MALTTLDQATYLGGGFDDRGGALAIHPTSGDVYVAGDTSSTDFPGTAGGAQPAIGGTIDVFAAHLNVALTTLDQATYLGGGNYDYALYAPAVAIHPTSGDVYVTGVTFSTDFPGTTGGAQEAIGGSDDAFVARLTPDLMAPVVSDLVTLSPLVTSFNPTSVPGGPAGTFTITATFKNTSSGSIDAPAFLVTQLSGENLLLDADGGAGGVGAKLTPDVGADRILAPGEAFTARFIIGLQHRSPFTFFVDLHGVSAQ